MPPRAGGLDAQDAVQLMLFGSVKTLYYAVLKQIHHETMSRVEREMVGEVMQLDFEAQTGQQG